MFARIITRKLIDLRPFARNATTHSRKQVDQIARSITRLGFTNPILISDDDEILSGHGRVAAARKLGSTELPTLIAAEKAGRRARLIELDPLHCDTIIRRWELATGKKAKLVSTGEFFLDVEYNINRSTSA